MFKNLTLCHGVLDHGLNLDRNIPLNRQLSMDCRTVLKGLYVKCIRSPSDYSLCYSPLSPDEAPPTVFMFTLSEEKPLVNIYSFEIHCSTMAVSYLILVDGCFNLTVYGMVNALQLYSCYCRYLTDKLIMTPVGKRWTMIIEMRRGGIRGMVWLVAE